ncbi:CLUMA_CG007232, isoform A [Clunio marinus]|uniref:CLUMA_CG007232, isoform A n=1 Tax=Clunio marinus TaxID=568069 RepID=A0A1J1I032_9DIPT|nr:CLUMA_CG007232, isoform A [Clunio marinus]
MDVFIKLNSEVAGKDKAARLLQYSCRALWDSLNVKNEAHLALIHQLKSLEYILSSFRKLLRFGKSLEVFYGALKSIHYSDAWLAFTITVNKISQSIFLFTDHIIWLARSGLVKDIDTVKWSQRSNKYWVLSLVMSIVRDIYEINRVVASLSSYKEVTSCIALSLLSIRSSKDANRCLTTLFDFLITYKHLTIDTVKNCCDLFIPLTSMGYIKVSPRVVGLLGMISSIAGLIVVLNPQCKLTP